MFYKKSLQKLALLSLVIAFSLSGTINSHAQYSIGSSIGSYGSNNGEFDNPTDIETDADGSIYVVDTDNDRIQIFSTTGTFVTEFGGNGQFNEPSGIHVDFDGAFEYSQILEVSIDGMNAPSPKVSIYPNPTAEFINVSGFDVANTVEVSIYKQTGQLVQAETLKEEGRLNIQSLESGLYIVKITSENRSYTSKVKKF